MAGPLTIDNYDVSVHERFAKDQEALEPVFLVESGKIPAHLDIAALDKSLLSKWEALFELDRHRHTFAQFAPPPRYSLMRNRFFSHVVSQEFDWAEEADEEDQEEQRKQEEKRAKLYKEKIKKTKCSTLPPLLFERERSHLLNLVDSIHLLNGFMREIHGRRLQYQKG